MRLTLPHVLVGVACFAFALGLILSVGLFFALTLSVLVATVAFFAYGTAMKWRASSARERRFRAVALLASVLAVMVGSYVAFETHIENVADSRKLQALIGEDPRFAKVTATYSGPADHCVLTLHGRVASQPDLAALETEAQNWGFKCTVVCHVEVSQADRIPRQERKTTPKRESG